MSLNKVDRRPGIWCEGILAGRDRSPGLKRRPAAYGSITVRVVFGLSPNVEFGRKHSLAAGCTATGTASIGVRDPSVRHHAPWISDGEIFRAQTLRLDLAARPCGLVLGGPCAPRWILCRRESQPLPPARRVVDRSHRRPGMCRLSGRPANGVPRLRRQTSDVFGLSPNY